MKLLVMTVYDAAVGAYLQPFFVRSKAEAVRVFADACKDEKHQFFTHPEDYTLFCAGIYDDSTGLVDAPQVLERLISALECSKAE